jgi:hypothetical protein
MCANAENMKEMGYRANEHVHIPGRTTDIFDSTHFRSLLGKRVVINGQEVPYTYFSDSRDIALGLATDGFGPFKHRKSTAWPLILFNYNLGPENRMHIDKIVPLASFPVQRSPWTWIRSSGL